MILDSSALVAVILAEPGCQHLLRRMGEATALGVGAPTVAEAAIVLSARLRRDARALLNELLREAEVEIIPFGPEHYSAAVTAFQRFGKGRHPAALLRLPRRPKNPGATSGLLAALTTAGASVRDRFLR